MNKPRKPGEKEGGGELDEVERTVRGREQALANRETWLRSRERITGEHAVIVADREEALDMREAVLRTRAEADAARIEREHLLLQMREANERLVVAMLRADDLVDQVNAARADEAERRRQAEALAEQLRASEEELRVRAAEAQESNRAKDAFLAMLGHEMRTPLAPILIALDLVALDRYDLHKREHAIIQRQVQHLVRLVDDLLDVSRIRSGKVELQRQPIELADVVARAVELVTPLIASKNHTLMVDVPRRGLTIDGDQVRLVQVVGNLMTNAAKYTPPGGTIAVTGELRDNTIVLRIRDSGIGITKEMLPRIFEVFAQDHHGHDHAAGGLGLGLAIVRSLVTMHDGVVTAHSEGLGKGTELVIELPASTSQTVGRAESPTLESIPMTTVRILVVDHNQAAAQRTAAALTRVGHDVRVVFDCAAAIDLIAEFVPEVVLLDLGSPGMDGYEVVKRLRGHLSAHDVGFIALGGYGQPIDHQRSHDAGIHAHLVKPVGLATLQRYIEEVRRLH